MKRRCTRIKNRQHTAHLIVINGSGDDGGKVVAGHNARHDVKFHGGGKLPVHCVADKTRD